MLVTPKQREILEYLRQGLSSQKIAERSFLSRSTVDNVIYGLCNKFGCDNRVSLIDAAWEAGLFRQNPANQFPQRQIKVDGPTNYKN